MTHLTEETRGKLARRELPPAELMAALRHLGTCADCATLASPNLEADVDAVKAALGEKDERRRWFWPVAIAASIAIVLALLALRTFYRQALPTAPVTTSASDPAPSNPEWTRLIQTALTTGRLPFPADLDSLRRGPDVFRGTTGEAPEIVRPAGIVTDETRPRFSWPAQAGAAYVVSVFEGDREIARSEPLRVNGWTPERDLPRGRTYVWQVRAQSQTSDRIIPGPPSPPARFRIVSEEDHRDLHAAMTQHPGDRILHAVLLARSGLHDEALAAVRDARAAGDPRVAKLIALP